MSNSKLYELWHEFQKLPPRTSRADRRDAELEYLLYRLRMFYRDYKPKKAAATSEPEKRIAEEERELADTAMELCNDLYTLLRLPYGKPMKKTLGTVLGRVDHYDRPEKPDPEGPDPEGPDPKRPDLLSDQIHEALKFLTTNEAIAQLDGFASPSEHEADACLGELTRHETNIREAARKRALFPWDDAVLALVTRWMHRVARVKSPYKDRLDANISPTLIRDMTKWEAFRVLRHNDKKTEFVAYVYPAAVLKEAREIHYPSLYRLKVAFTEGESDVSANTPIYSFGPNDRLFIEVNVCPRFHSLAKEARAKQPPSALLWEPLNDPDRRAVAITINRLTTREWQNMFGEAELGSKLIIKNGGSYRPDYKADHIMGVISLWAYLMTPLGPVRSEEAQIALQ